MWLGWAGLALAHPGAFRVAAHDLTATVSGDAFTLEYTLEAPRLLELHDAPAHDVVPSIEEMQSGFILRLDDQPVPLSAVGDAVLRDSHTTAAVSATFSATVPRGTRTLTLENANYPQLDGLFRTTWLLGPRWQFAGGSEWSRGDDGSWARTDRSEWTGTDAGRSSTLDVRPRPSWHAWTTLLAEEPQPALSTAPASLPRSWHRAKPHPWLAPIAMVLAPLAGVMVRRPDTAPRLPIVVAMAVVAGLAAGLASPGLIAGGLIIGLIATAVSRQWWLGGLIAAVGLASASSLWPWAVLAAALAGAVSRRGEPTRANAVSVGIAVGVTLLWGIRWAG